ncbi:uncharacterized protein LOC131597505 [Vicia villosa]|uniref:uncharacterized protein LOC131597505 n=1 Tax=Vicia villosa TaxID=3911 RepID=UPI00273C7E07|nr:uncharacterized protein LOC131597505 [Vicia villosa]
MEYLHRLTQKIQKDPTFKHHAKCKKLGLTNLIFADDVQLFCRGDLGSIQVMMNTLRKFTASTGLKLSPSKCKIYYGSLDEQEKDILRTATNFDEGTLPVKYLGVPLTSKKLSLHHYLPLIDKIVNKMKHWTTKLLSYAGRVQLVKSVSSAIAFYLMQCFPLPKGVLQKIDAHCRSFIWTSSHTC